MRWFRLDGGGVIPSAVLHGNPPTGLAPSRCAADRPLPTSITLSAAARPGRALRLEARGIHVDVVGFAARYAEDPASPQEQAWHQLAMSSLGARRLATTWEPDRLRNPPAPGGSVLVVAAACLGGQGPTDVVAARRVPLRDPAAATAVTLGDAERVQAARAACVYPRAG